VPTSTWPEYDIFVYDLNTGNLFQVTNTPVNETLNDITVCGGVGRIVFGAPSAEYNVLAFTFQVPSSSSGQITDLIALVRSFSLQIGIENSLVTKLQFVIAALEVPDTTTACNYLTSFINETQAQSGKKLTTSQASQLISAANPNQRHCGL